MKVADIQTQVAEVLQDAGGVTWTSAQLWGWIHDAELAVITVRPDANSKLDKVALVTGTRQSIAGLSGALRLLDVVRNVGPADEPRRAVRQVARSVLDQFNPDWHQAAAAAQPTEFCLDERDPRGFWCSPPSDGTGYLQVLHSCLPASYNLADPNQLITVPDSYVPALIEWALYRAFSRDAEESPNPGRAQGHLQTFFHMLGVKGTADAAYALPKEVRRD